MISGAKICESYSAWLQNRAFMLKPGSKAMITKDGPSTLSATIISTNSIVNYPKFLLNHFFSPGSDFNVEK
jgi:hypothetical protein